MPRPLSIAAASAAVLSACAMVPPAPQPAPEQGAAPAASAATAPRSAPMGRLSAGIRYRCDHGLAFSAVFGADSVTIDAGRQGRDEALRDAGRLTPQQTVYSDDRLRAEFGLGDDGRQAVLHYAQPPVVAHCTRESAAPPRQRSS